MEEQVLQRLRRLTEPLGRGGSLDDVLVAAGVELREYAGRPLATVVLRDRQGQATIAGWHAIDEPLYDDLRRATEAVLKNGSDAADSLRQLLMGEDREVDEVIGDALVEERAKAAESAGLKRVYAFSVEADGVVRGVVELFSDSDEPAPGDLIHAAELVRSLLALSASRDRAHAAVSGAASHIRQLTEQIEPTTQRLQEFEERYSLLCRGARPGLWDWDLGQDKVFYSARWKASLGYGPQEVGDEPSEWFDRIHPDDKDRVELEILEHMEWQSQRFESEHRVLHRDGTYRHVVARGVGLHDEAGKAYRIAGSLTDVTDVRTRHDQTARDLMYHRLTGLATHAVLVDRIEMAMRRRTRRPDRSFAVVALSLDGLEETAERVGGEATEELMLAISRRVANVVRPGDSLGHVDDLEFGILLDDVKSMDDALEVGQRVATSLAQPIPLGSEQVTLTPALGLALSRASYESPVELMRDASIALRRARRSEVELQVFDAATKAYAQSIVELEGDLRQAFDTRSLFLEYQPVVSLGDGRITGVEAFIRWKHEERGLIPPNEFLPVAQEAGLMSELGYWVTEQACRQMKDWIERLAIRFPPTMAVNVSHGQLFDEEFVGRTLAAVEAAGLDTKLLRLDVSEGTFMKDGPAAGRILRAITEHGFRVAIDDFGTGYSSLSYLHRYPIGALKIDRAFVSGTASASHDWDVARTVIELARILELEVIAEGIETREQFTQLRSLGCQQAQGYFFSGPVSAVKAGKLIQDGYPLDLEALTT
jgi:diguanylate cyclase (GGDEF)-like protein/PAS domain S-box-containing protein